MATKTNNAEVVVGISTYNRADILPKAIESAFQQSYPSLKVAVLDDGSSDATPSLAKHFPQAEWTRWTPNRGYAAARNFLMLNSRAEYYVSLDDDAWFLQGDEIALAIEILVHDPGVAAIAFDILSPDRPTVARRDKFFPVALFIGCGHVLRLDAVRRLGGYASFPGGYGCEEKDLCLRLLDAGYEVVKLPGVHVWHDKTQTARDVKVQHGSGVCNDLTLTLRRTPSLVLPLAIAWKFIRHFQFAAANRLLSPYWAGVRAFLGSAPAIWRSRQPVRLKTIWRSAKLTHG